MENTFLDFFAGSGLVSEGLRDYFRPIWANDISRKKVDIYLSNHDTDIFILGSIRNIHGSVVPEAMLSWGSFPCQDISLAGKQNGLASARSGLVWEWLRVMDEMKSHPPIIVAENVVGLLSSNNGHDYKDIHASLVNRGYNVGAVILDASSWVPQSRKRVFVIAVKKNVDISRNITDGPIWCHTRKIVEIANNIHDWTWWYMPKPSARMNSIEDIVEKNASCLSNEKAMHLLKLIPDSHIKRVEKAIQNGRWAFPGYRRIRHGNQVLELRFDGLAGCLRTPSGGSSRQYIVLFKDNQLCIRLLTIDEASQLMGAGREYKLPGSYNDAYRAMGDAVVVPVTKYIAENLLYPISREIEETHVQRAICL
ncbi:MAG: DNA cytosine methyltransferase [Candidatus Cloacimonetes bacterium]|nr:DNA cytosine methyltransferase [Candidatus Cloacimonadota bacterium]